MNNSKTQVTVTRKLIFDNHREVLLIDGPRYFIKMLRKKEIMISDMLTGLDYYVYRLQSI